MDGPVRRRRIVSPRHNRRLLSIHRPGRLRNAVSRDGSPRCEPISVRQTSADVPGIDNHRVMLRCLYAVTSGARRRVRRKPSVESEFMDAERPGLGHTQGVHLSVVPCIHVFLAAPFDSTFTCDYRADGIVFSVDDVHSARGVVPATASMGKAVASFFSRTTRLPDMRRGAGSSGLSAASLRIQIIWIRPGCYRERSKNLTRVSARWADGCVPPRLLGLLDHREPYRNVFFGGLLSDDHVRGTIAADSDACAKTISPDEADIEWDRANAENCSRLSCDVLCG